ncbi:MAG: hypothetical protein HQL12_04765 [Candidatus Omnitrophica bacterium]|nr:hypothetical protein [Candidatus Omnitrophota bacterium]
MPIDLDCLLPLACEWVESKEKEILKRGQSLSNELQVFSKKIGIKYPEKVRFLVVDTMPLPEHPLLQQACKETELISGNTAGLTLGYGILLRKDCVHQQGIYKHELAHVLQYEQLGGIKQFLDKYLTEILTVGYFNAPMEQEARNKENL